MVVIWLPIVVHMVHSNQKKELVFGLRPGKGKEERARQRERGQSCGGHILQRHIYYFTTALGKEAALGLC